MAPGEASLVVIHPPYHFSHPNNTWVPPPGLDITQSLTLEMMLCSVVPAKTVVPQSVILSEPELQQLVALGRVREAKGGERQEGVAATVHVAKVY